MQFFSPADSIGTGTVHTSWKMTCVTGLPLDLFQPPDPKSPGTLLSPPSPVSAPTKKLSPANNCGGISQLWIPLQQPASERSVCRPKHHHHLQLGFFPPRPILLPNPILLIIFPMASPSHPLQQTPQAQVQTNQFEEQEDRLDLEPHKPQLKHPTGSEDLSFTRTLGHSYKG